MAPSLRMQASKGARSRPHRMHTSSQALATCLEGTHHLPIDLMPCTATGCRRHAACYTHSGGGGADEGRAPFHSSKAGTRKRSAPSRVSRLLMYALSRACGCDLLPPAPRASGSTPGMFKQ
jgi:hypothetical protein